MTYGAREAYMPKPSVAAIGLENAGFRVMPTLIRSGFISKLETNQSESHHHVSVDKPQRFRCRHR